jgi:hypothetical protein
MRNVADFVPECASICPELTYHILTTGPGNTRCLKHSITRPKITAVKEDGGKDKEDDTAIQDRILDCGCLAKNAMWEFYMFKTGRIQDGESVVGWDRLRMDPRMRDLVFEQVAEETCWDLDDIWRYEKNPAGNFTVARSRIPRTQNQINRLIRKLEGLIREKEEEKAEKYVPGPCSIEGPLDAGYKSPSSLSSS